MEKLHSNEKTVNENRRMITERLRLRDIAINVADRCSGSCFGHFGSAEG
jgi:hypothetical protein